MSKTKQPDSLKLVSNKVLTERYDDYIYSKIFSDDIDEQMKLSEVNMEKIICKVKHISHCYKFNIFLKRMNKEGYRLMDIIIYLENKYANFKKIISALNDENLHNLKLELVAINPKLKLKTNKLKHFFKTLEEF